MALRAARALLLLCVVALVACCQLSAAAPAGPDSPRRRAAWPSDWERRSALMRRLRDYDPRWDEPLPQPPGKRDWTGARVKRAKAMTPTDFLEKFGYLRPEDETYQHEPADREHACKMFQTMYHLNPTGKLDDATMKAMVMPRCGMMDMVPRNMPPTPDNPLAPEKFVVPGYKWTTKQLTWNFKNDFNRIPAMTPAIQKRAIQQALQYWQDNSGLQFSETSEKGNINIKYCPAYVDHGDGQQNAFDGPSGVLAHAFYPDSGEMHLDETEQWTDEQDAGINLKIVAAHELGHALGLGHSDKEGALMAPFYQGFVKGYQLPLDDKQAIQSLYGQHEGEAPKPPPPPRSTVTPLPPPKETTKMMVPVPPSGSHPDTCTLSFNAVTQTHDDRVYVYSGQWMWRMSDYGLDDGFPVTINTYYENPPDSIQAALFSPRQSYTWFFKGNEVWKYYGFQLDMHKVINTRGYPSRIKAALMATDGTIYLLQNGNCWAFDEDRMDITSSTHVPCAQVFPGLPSSYDSAVRLHTDPGYIYFFHGYNYQKYSVADKKVLSGYPKKKAGPWMGPACGAQPYTPK